MRECNAVIKCVCNKYLASNTKKLKMHTNGAHWEDQKETQRTCLRERAAARGSQSRVYISVPIDGRRRREHFETIKSFYPRNNYCTLVWFAATNQLITSRRSGHQAVRKKTKQRRKMV